MNITKQITALKEKSNGLNAKIKTLKTTRSALSRKVKRSMQKHGVRA